VGADGGGEIAVARKVLGAAACDGIAKGPVSGGAVEVALRSVGYAAGAVGKRRVELALAGFAG
jgi:hypothetical protein